MRTPLCMLTLSFALGVALAQQTPQTTPTNPPANTQPDAKTGSPAASASTTPAEMKTATYKGVLVDMACASHASAGAEATPAASAATEPSDRSKPAKSNTANRSTSDSGPSCPVSANTSELGMKLDDGKTVRFDLVGNQRAQDALKNDKRWNKDLSANKPIHAKVSGVLNGDKLIVSSIN
jgi:hypothetical protein